MSKIPFYIDYEDLNTLRVMNPTGVQQNYVPRPSIFNASWDALLSKEGKVYVSLCSELTTNEYTKLAEYDPIANTLKELHYTKELIFSDERFIRDSKFHTAMAWMNDGRMVVLTHTTDKSPEHPAWLPQSYFNHPFEGYPGSSLLTFDPKTGKMENWGIPVHRETIYGAAYDKINNIYYGIGYFKGHLYGIDLNDRSVRDYGEVTERASYRLVVGPDDNIYFTTRNGLLQRINVRTREVENTRINLPFEKVPGRFRPYLSAAANGPDGKLYMAGMHDKTLSRYNPETNKLEKLGEFMPAEVFCKQADANIYMGSMGFDKNNMLYYVVSAVKKNGREDWLLPSMLMRWDILKEESEPEILGLLGTKDRTTYQCCMMVMDTERDLMICAGTNHCDDGPNFISVDLSQYREHALELGEPTVDPMVFQGNGVYDEYAEMMHKGATLMRENSAAFHQGKEIAVQLWPNFRDAEIENSAVADLYWEGDKLIAVCGKEHFTKFTIAGDKIESISSCKAPVKPAKPQVEGELPRYPGRKYKALPALEVALSEGRRLIATEDGLLAIEKNGKLFSLGAGWVNGPVRAMTANQEGTLVYGVAGDEDDLGIVFSYDDERGLRWLGTVMTGSCEYGYHGSDLLTAVALREDGTLAVGSGGRMGMVFIYEKE